MGQTLMEALAVVLAGAALAFGANAWNDRGLEWGRDYFPRSVQAAAGLPAEPAQDAPRPDTTAADPPAPDTKAADTKAADPTAADPTAADTTAADTTAADTPATTTGGVADAHGGEQEIIARLEAKGLRAIGHDDFVALMADPMMAAGAYLVLDARRAADYAEGHIPGAVHFDPFYPEQFLPDLMPLLPVAQRIVVYCNGGVCDDSESAALILSSFVASPDLIEVYVGGISAWRDAGLQLDPG